MFRALSLVAAISVIGCGPETDPEFDKEVALIRESLPGINQKCTDAYINGGPNAVSQDVRECFPMEESKRWTGLWLDEFEGSRFCAYPAEECTFDTEGERIWLSFAEKIGDEARASRYATEQLYKIDFIGRQTSLSGNFGHFGGSDKEIVVEQLLMLERVPER